MAEPQITLCPRCGHTNQAGALNCSSCGTRLMRELSNSSVAAREAALAQKLESRGDSGGMAHVAFIAVLAVVFGILGAPTDLVCQRYTAGGSIYCIQTTRLLWIIALPERHIDDVRGAQVVESLGTEDWGPGYRVELQTGTGTVPLMSTYSSGRSAKDQVARKVNGLVENAVPGMVAVTEPGLLGSDTLPDFAIWIIVLAGGAYFWKVLRLFSGRATSTR